MDRPDLHQHLGPGVRRPVGVGVLVQDSVHHHATSTAVVVVVVVDEDVDLFDAAAVEWAIATRFQADRDLLIFAGQPSSSLDPSAQLVPGKKARSAKMGLDATIPWTDVSGRPLSEAERASFRKVRYDAVDLARYLAAGS